MNEPDQKTPRKTVVWLVTPHVLKLVDLAEQGDKGLNVERHVQAAVAGTVDALGEQFNFPDLLRGYMDGLQSAADNAPRHRKAYVEVLESALRLAQRELARVV